MKNYPNCYHLYSYSAWHYPMRHYSISREISASPGHDLVTPRCFRHRPIWLEISFPSHHLATWPELLHPSYYHHGPGTWYPIGCHHLWELNHPSSFLAGNQLHGRAKRQKIRFSGFGYPTGSHRHDVPRLVDHLVHLVCRHSSTDLRRHHL